MALQSRVTTFQPPKIFSSSPYPESIRYLHLPTKMKTNFITLYTRSNPPNATSSSHKPYRESFSDDEDSEEEQPQPKTQPDSQVMNEEERKEWRAKIREVINSSSSEVSEITDPIQKKTKMEELLSEYPLIVNEEDPNWPEHDEGDGWGFSLGQFFDKITIKNVRKDDEDYDSDKEIVWQDDDYIRPIKEIKTVEWEETVFKDISPLVVFVHNRYRRPKENEKVRGELEKVAHIFWNCGLPSPRCVAVDAVVEDGLVEVLGVEVFPEVLFTKAGKILYREKGFRTAEELSKIMGFFYYGAAKPKCLEGVEQGNEFIPSAPVNSM